MNATSTRPILSIAATVFVLTALATVSIRPTISMSEYDRKRHHRV